MSAPSTSSIIRVPGVLIWNPTDLGQSEPYGGTYIGQVRGIRFAANPKYRTIWDETTGSVIESIYGGEGPCELHAIARYPDSDFITTVAPKSISSGSAGVAFTFRPGGTTGNTRAGTAMGTRAGKLLFAPKAVNAHPMVLLYNAMPFIEEDMELRLSLKEEWGLGVRFVGTADSNGKVYIHGRRAAITIN